MTHTTLFFFYNELKWSRDINAIEMCMRYSLSPLKPCVKGLGRPMLMLVEPRCHTLTRIKLTYLILPAALERFYGTIRLAVGDWDLRFSWGQIDGLSTYLANIQYCKLFHCWCNNVILVINILYTKYIVSSRVLLASVKK